MEKEKINKKPENTATIVIVKIFGIIGGLTGLGHGIFEILQGNNPTKDIGSRIGAFTIFPTYLLTGSIVVCISLVLLMFIIFQIEKSNSCRWLFVIIICLFLAGGGVAPIILLLLVNLVATQIHNPLFWWKRINSRKSLELGSITWKYILLIGNLLLISGIGIWLFVLPPGKVYEITYMHYLCWAFLLVGFCLIVLSIFAGFSYDARRLS